MKLSEFLNKFNLKDEFVISYSGDEALEAVKRHGHALRYVKDQSEAVCLEAVKQDGHALKYVDETIFDKED